MEVKYLALQQLQMRSATLESPTYLKTKQHYNKTVQHFLKSENPKAFQLKFELVFNSKM